MVKVINQIVDTLKLHYYATTQTDSEMISSYNNLLDKLIDLKRLAQNNSADLKSTLDINYKLGVMTFNVMPKSVKGFSVIIHNADVSIAMRRLTNVANNAPIIKVEFRAEFLARYGYKKCIKHIENLVTNYLFNEFRVNISEIHLATDIQGHEFNHLDYFRFQTRARNSQVFEDNESYSTAYGSLSNFTGFVYGSGNYMLRVYNKTKEIQKFKNKGFIKDYKWNLNPDYDESINVWRIEIQIRREKLKKLVDDNYNTFDNYVTVLENIPALWSRAVNDFRFLDISDKVVFDLLRGWKEDKKGNKKFIKKYARQKIFQRANISITWETIKTFNNYEMSPAQNAFILPKKGSPHYVNNAIKALYSTMGKAYGSINSSTLTYAFFKANEMNKTQKGISLIDDVVNKQLDYFERINYTRLFHGFEVADYKDLEDDIYNILADSDYIYKDRIEETTKERYLNIINSKFGGVEVGC